MDTQENITSVVQQPQAPHNPLLDKVRLPGETFTLPSGGLFYNNGELADDVENAEVHVYPMTTIDEIMLKTPDMLFSGQAVKQVFAHCIPQVNDTDNMLSKDIDFLLVCLRKVSYGNEMQIDYTHDCDDAKEHTYTIDVNNFIHESKRIDPTTVITNFSVTLPNDQVVKFHPITFKDFVKVMQMNDPDNIDDPEIIKNLVIDSISSLILSVDDTTDMGMIKEWLNKIPPLYIKQINDHVENTLDWGTSFEVKTICKDCNQQMEVTAPMNPLYFFT